jgi:small multidrug resistance pump
MNIGNPYIFLFLAIIFGTASNSFAKSAEGFTHLLPSLASAITIILCMYALSNVMKEIPIGVTYASFAGLCIVATAAVGVIKYNQLPNFFTIIGLLLIIVGVLMVNLLGKSSS